MRQILKNKYTILILLITLSVLLGFRALKTPKPEERHSEAFSAERASAYLQYIALQPHTVKDQEALAYVRNYLIEELNDLEVETEVFTYENVQDKYGDTYDVNNIYAKIDGKDGEDGSYIMLVAHYDSSPKKRDAEEEGSFGAADDGYGLTTILEIVNLIQSSDKELVNGIKILFTDAEEVGLLGAEQEMTNNRDIYDNVSYVINLEARGIKGPAIMFETSENNYEVVNFYREANYPFTYSLASDVYNKMVNGSDFTHYKNAGLQGINIAVLDNLDYYHTTKDNIENISLTSMQHYGEQVYPLVENFVYNEKYSDPNVFDSDENAIFFTFLPNILVFYSTTIGYILCLLALIFLITTIIIYNKNKFISFKKIGLWFLIWIAIIAIFSYFGYLISRTLAILFGIEFKIMYMPKIPNTEIIIGISVLLIGLAIYRILAFAVSRGEKLQNIAFGGLILNYVMLIVFMIYLPGGSFIFLFPILFGLIPMFLYSLELQNENIPLYSSYIPIAFIIILFVPILYMLSIALTIGSLAVIIIFATFAFSIMIPILVDLINSHIRLY